MPGNPTCAPKHPCAVGIDGCRFGWIAAIYRPSKAIDWILEKRIKDVILQLPQQSLIFVDMIIGLPEASKPSRECDSLTRKRLAPHGSRVFNAPIREVLNAKTYAEANQISQQLSGKGLSKQTWYLLPKIRELDQMHSSSILEAHPELAYTQQNAGIPISDSKKTAEGRKKRLQLLEIAGQAFTSAYHAGLKKYTRREAAQDDLLDALILCARASSSNQTTPLPREPQPDAKGHPCQIWS